MNISRKKKGALIGLPALALAGMLGFLPLAAHAEEAAPEETNVSEEVVVTEEVITEEVVETTDESTPEEVITEEVVETAVETTEEETPQAPSALRVVQQTVVDEVDYGHAGTPYPNTSDSNKEEYWEDENTQCFKFEGDDMIDNDYAYLTNDGKTVVLKPGTYTSLIVKAANTDLVNTDPVAGLPGYHAVDFKEISHYIVCGTPPPVDYCDASQKPGGVSIAQWLEDNGINPADCFEYELVQECGQFDVDITKAPVGISYGFQYALGADQDTVYPGLSLPAVFAEDEGGGTVQITIWMVGGESDYVRGTDIPNYWDNNGLTITIDTDCAPAEGVYPTVTVIPEYCEHETGGVTGGSITVEGGENVKSVTVYDANMVEVTDTSDLPDGEYTVMVVFNDGTIAPTAEGWTIDENDPAKASTTVTVENTECDPEVEVVTPVLPTFTTCPVTLVLPDGVTKVEAAENIYEGATAFYEVNEDSVTIHPKPGTEFEESDLYELTEEGTIVIAFPAEGDCPTDEPETPGLALTGADISGGVLAALVLLGLGGLILALRMRRQEA